MAAGKTGALKALEGDLHKKIGKTAAGLADLSPVSIASFRSFTVSPNHRVAAFSSPNLSRSVILLLVLRTERKFT
jgi:hypothetical protein